MQCVDLKTTGLYLHSFTCWSQYWFPQTLNWSYYFCVRISFSISIHSIEAFLFAAFIYFFLWNMNFCLAAQKMEWNTYPIILCVCLCLLVFRPSDCVKKERCVKWYLVPVCHVVCGLFATLCTGPQGHTHYNINSCQLFCQRWNAHWPHAIEFMYRCVCWCLPVPSVLYYTDIYLYTQNSD